MDRAPASSPGMVAAALPDAHRARSWRTFLPMPEGSSRPSNLSGGEKFRIVGLLLGMSGMHGTRGRRGRAFLQIFYDASLQLPCSGTKALYLPL